MNDHELDRLIAQADPFGDQNRQLPGDAGADLLEEILTTTEPTPTARKPRRRPIMIAAAAAAVAAVVGLGGALLPDGNPAAPVSAYAAEVRAVAEANPRLLLDDSWKISYVGTFSEVDGELRFTKDGKDVSVHWRSAKEYQSRLDSVAEGSKAQPVEVLGQRGTRFQYAAPATDFVTFLPPKGVNYLEIRADLGSEQAYTAVLGKLRAVDVDTWLKAMPESAVKPDQTRKVVTGMLADIPVPNGFDTGKLMKSSGPTERYHVGADVTGTVTCAWIDQWHQAKKSGDKAKKTQAVKALAGSHSWKILIEMQAKGDFPKAVWETADEIVKHDRLVDPKQYKGKPTVEEIKQGLGCEA